MSRLVLAVGMAIALAGEGTAMAQYRTAQNPPPRPAAPPPPPPNAPAPHSGFTSRLTFDGRRATEPAFPRLPPVGVGRGSLFLPAFPFFWGWETWPPADVTRFVPLPPADAPIGGVQLDVLPWRASVFLDGVYVGRVEDFRGYYHHLDAAAGPHQIAIVAPGHAPLVLDLMVSAGRTTTYRGKLPSR